MHMVGGRFGPHDQGMRHESAEETVSPYGRGQVTGEEIGRRVASTSSRMWGAAFAGAGGAMLGWGLAQRSVVGKVVGTAAGSALIGVALAGRSTVTDLAKKGSGGLGEGSWMYLEDSVTVNRPVADVYRFVRDLRNLPRFMDHVEEVLEYETGRMRWKVRMPGNAMMTWTGRLVEDRPQESIMWRTDPDNPVDEVGVVRFEKVSADTTEVIMSVRYRPHGGKPAAVAARLLEGMTEGYMRRMLDELKQAAEERILPTPV